MAHTNMQRQRETQSGQYLLEYLAGCGRSLFFYASVCCFRWQDILQAVEALLWPVSLPVIEFGNRGCAGWNLHPGLFGGDENMNVRGQDVGIIQGPDANEFQYVTGSRVMTPHGNATCRATGNMLALAAGGGSQHQLRIDAEAGDTAAFNQGVECEGRAGFALAPATVTAVDEQGR